MGAVMNIGRSRAKVYNTEKPKTTFADVAGYGPVKQEIAEVVDFLKNPGKFKEIGARIPKGVLLVGPPGTGKTLIARAVAGEAGVPFVSVTGSDFMEMFVGVGAARVRDLFQTARKQAPAIIFVDEIDSIGRKRGAGLGGGHDEREQTLNQMLAEMDGFEATEGIVMMAATNRPDVLDPALLRPGRFDRQIMVPLPTQDERVAILKVHFQRQEDLAPTSTSTSSPAARRACRGADLVEPRERGRAVRGAARRRTRCTPRTSTPRATACSWACKRESMALTEEEKEVVAYHEGGHAVLAYVLEHADPVHKVTILPTGMALGVTQQLPVEERHIYKKEYIADSLVVRLGGRIAEEIVFGHLSTGAQNDLVGVHRARPQDGARVGHVRPHRPDGVGLAGRGVPRRGPRAHPRLLRRDRPRDRRRGRAHPPRRGEPRPQGARRAPRRARGGRARRCSSARPSTAPRSAPRRRRRWATRPAAPATYVRADGTEVDRRAAARGRVAQRRRRVAPLASRRVRA